MDYNCCLNVGLLVERSCNILISSRMELQESMAEEDCQRNDTPAAVCMCITACSSIRDQPHALT